MTPGGVVKALVAEGVCPTCRRDTCAGDCSRLRAYTLPELLAHRFPARRAILLRCGEAIFREGQTAEIVATRGIGKTWLLQTLALICAAQASALGITAPQRLRVLFIDGEMSSEEIQDRFGKLCRLLGIQPPELLTVVGADWQDGYLPRLDTAEGQAAIAPLVESADVIFLDNRSCLFDPEGEKDPTAWQPAQEWLLSLRRRGKAVIMGHHANRAGTARGISKAEDALNLLLKLERPNGYQQAEGARFQVTFEKARGVHGLAAAPFVAALTEQGWVLEGAEDEAHTVAGKIIDHLRLKDAIGERPKSANAAVAGAQVNRQEGLRAFAKLLKDGVVSKHQSGGYCLA